MRVSSSRPVRTWRTTATGLALLVVTMACHDDEHFVSLGFTWDPAALLGRCAWCEESRVKLDWTLFFVTEDEELIWVALQRSFDAAGVPRALVHVEQSRRTTRPRHLGESRPVSEFSLGAGGRALQVGRSRVRVEHEGVEPVLRVRLFVPREGASPWRLDADLRCEVEPWNQTDPMLVARRDSANYLEYDVPCPRASFSGTLTDDAPRAIRGRALVESIRWHRSSAPEPMRWYWGFAHSGPYSVMFFAPFYEGARGAIWASRDRDCVLCERGVRFGAPAPRADPSALVFTHAAGGVRVRLRVDRGPWSGAASTMALEPYRLEVKEPGRTHFDTGVMVFETGLWREF